MADRIVLLRDGVIEQQGAPLELYEHPATKYVAGFLGSPSMNFIPCTLVAEGDGVTVRFDDGATLPLPSARHGALASWRDKPLTLGLRPEHLSRASGEPRTGQARLTATIDLVQPTGSRTYANFRLGGVEAVAELQSHDVSQPGEKLDLFADMHRAVLIDATTGRVVSNT